MNLPPGVGTLPPGRSWTAGLRRPDAAGSAPMGAGVPIRRRLLRRSLIGLTVGLLVLLVSSVTGLLPLQIMRVGSASMSPTIAAGDLVLLERGGGAVERMDLVAVERPDTGVQLVKRAVALGGDRVAIEDGILVVNGTAVCEPSIDPARLDGVWFGPVTVPSGELFLLGDDRASSIDSRAFGTVPAVDLRGFVGSRLWPSPGPLRADRC